MKRTDYSEQIKKHKAILAELEEHHHPELTAYHHWLVLPESKKRELDDQWFEYYQKVRKTPAFDLYKEMIFMTKRKRVSKLPHCDLDIYRLRMKAKKMMANNEYVYIKKPSLFDPTSFTHSEIIQQYKVSKKKLNDMINGGTFTNTVQGILS